MESLIKRDLINIARFIALLGLLASYIPKFKGFDGDVGYSWFVSFAWFALLAWTDYSKSWKILDDETKTKFWITGTVVLSLQFICWVYILIEHLLHTVTITWVGILLTSIGWALIGGIYLLIGLTKTKDESKM